MSECICNAGFGINLSCPVHADPTPAGTGPGAPSEVKPRGPTTHDLKTWPVSYAAVASGRKCFELRKADRDFRTGDYLRLREYAMDGYTGDELLVGPVQYIAEVGAWVDVPEPFVVLGFPSHRAAPVAADARADAGEPSDDFAASLPKVAESCPACEDDGKPCQVCHARAATPPGAASGTRERETARPEAGGYLDDALRAAEQAVKALRAERPNANTGAICYAALKAALPIWRAAVPPPSGAPGEGEER